MNTDQYAVELIGGMGLTIARLKAELDNERQEKLKITELCNESMQEVDKLKQLIKQKKLTKDKEEV